MLVKILVFGLLLTSGVQCSILDTISDIVDEIGEEVAAVMDPVMDIAAALIFSQCNLIKNMLQVQYEDYEDVDISSLKLVYKTPSVEVSMSLDAAANDLLNSNYEFGEKIYFILHGFIATYDSDNELELNHLLLNKGNSRVFMLDANSMIGLLYLRSTTYIQYIGEALGEVLNALYQKGVDPKSIHLIGHSLGAHMCGFAGRHFTNLTGLTIGRISGLDPAGPCFADIEDVTKLMKTDADFVDVIHTNAGIAGNDENLGHVDYYPNGGSLQPGCAAITCNHGRSWELYAESVNGSYAFPSIKCDTYNDFKESNCYSVFSYMGFNSNKTDENGTYYLMTNEEEAFDLGEEGLVYDSTTMVTATTDIITQMFSTIGDLIGLDVTDIVTSILS